MKNYITLLKEKKLTVTPQRLELLSTLFKHGHLNIDDLYKYLSIAFPSVSLATVYKNINNMLDKSLLMEVQIPKKKNVYELMKNEHSHVNCIKCDKILDINLNTESMRIEAELKSEYKLNFSQIVFNGVCLKCQI